MAQIYGYDLAFVSASATESPSSPFSPKINSSAHLSRLFHTSASSLTEETVGPNQYTLEIIALPPGPTLRNHAIQVGVSMYGLSIISKTSRGFIRKASATRKSYVAMLTTASALRSEEGHCGTQFGCHRGPRTAKLRSPLAVALHDCAFGRSWVASRHRPCGDSLQV
ncbi:hypothetical protein BHM03_00055807 [Ensete ventricosum]|nr:hypothetical protein BHM03_00055807 [Ensete ventricosum]